MATLEFTIDGMHCGGCVKRVEEALKKVPGAVAEKVEVGHARVTVEGTSPEVVVAALEKIGFDAHVTKEA